MKLIIAVICITIMSNNLIADFSQKWNYQYEVKLAGTRSEYIIGSLTYDNKPLSNEWGNVITPVGEFSFTDARGWVKEPLRWVPVTVDSYGSHLHITETDVKRLLSGDDKSFRKWVATADVKASETRIFIIGKFENPPNGVGSDWFYVVKQGWWVNPKKITEALKTLPK